MTEIIVDQIQRTIANSTTSTPAESTAPTSAGASPLMALCMNCEQRIAGEDGLCQPCRFARQYPRPSKHPALEPQLIEDLRLACVGNVMEISANLTRLSRQTKIPKKRLLAESRKRGLRNVIEHRPWIAEEIEYLHAKLGTMTAARIAKNLKRSVVSVESRVKREELSRRVAEGYNISDLSEVFGQHHCRIENWARRGLLGKAHGHGEHGGNIRFSEASVVRFIRACPYEYDLGRVDQAWFKGMVFGHLAEFGDKV